MDAIARQLEQLHHTDAQDIDVRPLLRLVRDIIERDTAAVEGESVGTISKSLKEKYNLNNLQGAPKLPYNYILKQITCEMTCKVRSGANAHSTTLAVLGVLQDISWRAKVVLTLTAFTLEYKHLWILVQINKYSKNALGKAIVKRFPMAVEEAVFNEINNLVKAMLETTQCIVEFGELPTNYISTEDTQVKDVKKHVPTTVYWIITNVVAAATYITTLSNTKYKSTTSELELSQCLAASQLNAASQELKQRLNKLYELIEERKDTDDINKIKEFLYHTTHTDNLEVLDAFISAKLEVPPLYDGINKKRVNLDLLRKRHVLLLISCLDITPEQLFLLERSYTDSRKDSYDIVWLPVIDDINVWTDDKNAKFKMLKCSMPWYSVDHPLMIENAAIKFIKKEWHFKGSPILVVLDPQGKVVSPNAIHMMWIWPSTAFPFTSAREEALWAQETWRLELLVNFIDPKILDWIREEKYIFVFGGDEMEWIRKFTKEAHAVARCLGVSVEMVYVGRSRNKELVRRVTDRIVIEKLSHCWNDPTFVWYFWTRIKRMIYSKVQLGKNYDYGDEILIELQRLNSHDVSTGGWAILAKGSKIIVNGHGKIALYTLEDFDKQWKEIAQKQGLDVGFGLHYRELLRRSYPSIKIEFPSNVVVPKSMLCPECRRDMNIYSSFICDHEEQIEA